MVEDQAYVRFILILLSIDVDQIKLALQVMKTT
jgi:hypothetical protein